MTVSPIRLSAQVIDLQEARIRRLAAENPDLARLLDLAGHLARAGRFADLDALVAAVQTAWGSEASYAERAEAVAVINVLLRSAVAA